MSWLAVSQRGSAFCSTRVITRAYRPLLEPLGLTYPQYLVMLSLWERDGVSVTALGEHTRLDKATLTSLLKRMASKGLLTRETSREDERRKRICLTSQGRLDCAAAPNVPAALAASTGMTLEGLSLCDTLHRCLTGSGPAREP